MSMSLREAILAGSWFSPPAAGFITSGGVAHQLRDHSEQDIQRALESLQAENVIVLREENAKLGKCYVGTPAASRMREHVLRQYGMRLPCLMSQRSHSPSDLVMGILMAEHIHNRLAVGYMGGPTSKSVDEMCIYLSELSREEVSDAVAETVRRGWTGPAAYRARADVEEFDLTIRGHTAYEREVGPRLGLGPDESILKLRLIKSLGVFLAWQSDYNPSRTHLNEALQRVLPDLNTSLRLIAPPELWQATEAGDGAVRIDLALQNKIAEATFFVGDLTPVHRYSTRLMPNPNVLVEAGYALASKEPGDVFLVKRQRAASEIPGEDNPHQQMPFDIAHVRAISYQEPAQLRRALLDELKARLQAKGLVHPGAAGGAEGEIAATA